MTSIPCTALLDAFALFRRCIATIFLAFHAVSFTIIAKALVLAGRFRRFAWHHALASFPATALLDALTLQVFITTFFILRTRVFWFRLVMALTIPPILAFTFAYCRVVTRELFLTGAFMTVVRVITTKVPLLTRLLFLGVIVYRYTAIPFNCSDVRFFKGTCIKGILGGIKVLI